MWFGADWGHVDRLHALEYVGAMLADYVLWTRLNESLVLSFRATGLVGPKGLGGFRDLI